MCALLLYKKGSKEAKAKNTSTLGAPKMQLLSKNDEFFVESWKYGTLWRASMEKNINYPKITFMAFANDTY